MLLCMHGLDGFSVKRGSVAFGMFVYFAVSGNGRDQRRGTELSQRKTGVVCVCVCVCVCWAKRAIGKEEQRQGGRGKERMGRLG